MGVDLKAGVVDTDWGCVRLGVACGMDGVLQAASRTGALWGILAFSPHVGQEALFPASLVRAFSLLPQPEH